ncbi:hypothetical protein GCM10009605_24290 [Nocardiopsis composta]
MTVIDHLSPIRSTTSRPRQVEEGPPGAPPRAGGLGGAGGVAAVCGSGTCMVTPE